MQFRNRVGTDNSRDVRRSCEVNHEFIGVKTHEMREGADRTFELRTTSDSAEQRGWNRIRHMPPPTVDWSSHRRMCLTSNTHKSSPCPPVHNFHPHHRLIAPASWKRTSSPRHIASGARIKVAQGRHQRTQKAPRRPLQTAQCRISYPECPRRAQRTFFGLISMVLTSRIDRRSGRSERRLMAIVAGKQERVWRSGVRGWRSGMATVGGGVATVTGGMSMGAGGVVTVAGAGV